VNSGYLLRARAHDSNLRAPRDQFLFLFLFLSSSLPFCFSAFGCLQLRAQTQTENKLHLGGHSPIPLPLVGPPQRDRERERKGSILGSLARACCDSASRQSGSPAAHHLACRICPLGRPQFESPWLVVNTQLACEQTPGQHQAESSKQQAADRRRTLCASLSRAAHKSRARTHKAEANCSNLCATKTKQTPLLFSSRSNNRPTIADPLRAIPIDWRLA